MPYRRAWLAVSLALFACGRSELDALAPGGPGDGSPARVDGGVDATSGFDAGAGDDAEATVPDTGVAPSVHREEYVIPYTSTGEVDVYDLDDGFALARTFTVPPLAGLTADNIRGVVASVTTGMLFVSWNPGSALGCDLVSGKVTWQQSYGAIDSMAITPDGTTLFLPSPDATTPGRWLVLDARTGLTTGSIDSGGAGPHNTTVTLDGSRVFLGPLDSNYLVVADAVTHAVLSRVGPTSAGVRPFTINGAGTLAFFTTSSLLGYYVGDVTTGKVLYTVTPPGFPYSQPTFAGTTGIAHGMSLSPDETELYQLDYPYSYVHVYDVTGLPGAPPKDVADIPLKTPLNSEGWLQHTRDGQYVVVGNSGDVIDAASRTIVANLPALRGTRIFTEVDVQSGRPVFTPLSRNQGGYRK
ncbi:MAG TPA: hypothetical protein VIF09_29510 [Polyangiaceae bacterium]